MQAANGGDFSEGFLDGATDGLMWGGVFALGGSLINAAKVTGSAVKASANAGYQPVKTGNVNVYHAVKGSQDYYGITNNLVRRANEHSKNGIKIIEHLDGSFTRSQARGIEQFLIQRGGLSNLANKINSISPMNPNYKNLVGMGEKLLGSSRWIPFI